MRRLACLTALLCLLAAPAAAEPLLPSDAPPPAPEGAVAVAPDEVVLDLTASIVPAEDIGITASPGGRWYLVDLANIGGEPEQKILTIEPMGLPGAGILRRAPARLVQLVASDADSPLRPLTGRIHPAYEIALPSAGPLTLALDVQGDLGSARVRLWEPNALALYERSRALSHGLMLGALLGVAAWLAALWVLSGARAFVAPALFIGAGVLLLFSAFGGFAELSLWGIVTAISVNDALLALTAMAGLGFIRHFLSLSVRDRRADMAAAFAQGALAGIAGGALFGLPVFDALARSGIVIAGIFMAGITLQLALQGLREARLLAPAMVMASLTATVAVLAAVTGMGSTSLAFEPGVAGGLTVALALVGFAAAAERKIVAPAPAPTTRAVRAPEGNGEGSAHEREQRYALGLAAAHQALWDWDVAEDRLYVSPYGEAMLGVALGTFRGPEETFAARVHPEDREVYRAALDGYRREGNVSFAIECRLQHGDSTWRWFQLRASGLARPGNEAHRIIGVLADVTERKESEARLAEDAIHDPLTGLPNRALFLDRVQREMRRAKPGDPRPAAVIVLDLDRFKAVNDSLGHAGGDSLLVALARRFEGAFTGEETVARLGGDEFAALIPGAAAGAAPEEAAHYLLELVAQPVTIDGREVHPRASAGIAYFETRHEFAEDLLRDAEIAMYQAKRQGRGRYDIYVPQMRDRRDEISLDSGLRRALEAGDIFLHYQPVMDLSEGRVAGFEGLIRWRDPERGVLTPEEFIPYAEETGLIYELGERALSLAADQLQRWQRFFPLPRPLFVSVNVSARQLLRPEFVKAVEEAFRGRRLLAGSLKLEVTESVVMENPEAAARALRRLRELGAGLSIDDFGTGFSSLSRLQRFPFDTIKIDRSFVARLCSEADSGVVVSTIVGLARDLGMAVVAEGVETEAELERLQEMGCQYAQGYWFGAPMDADEADRFVAMHWEA